MQLQPLKKFKCTVPVFFTASETIVKHCISNYDVLIVRKKAWENPYFPDLLAKLQESRARILGTDKFKEQRGATSALNTEQSAVLGCLSEFKVQFDVAFSDNLPQRDEILKVIGYADNYDKAKKGNQESLIALLSMFSKNMTPELQTTITDKKLDLELITPILGYAVTFADLESNQEKAKGDKPNLTAEITNELNGYYNIIIGICKIARNKFKGNRQKQDLFSLAKTVNAIIGGKSETEEASLETPVPEPVAN